MNNEKMIDELAELILNIKNGNISRQDAQEMSNAAGKIVNATKNAIEYSKLKKLGKVDLIKFMEN